jgi:hypothetical protein
MIVKIKIRKFLSFAIFLLLYSIVTASLFAGEKVYIEIKIDGEEIGKWVELASIDEYDSKGNLLHTKVYGDYSQYEFIYEYDSKGKLINTIYIKPQQNGDLYKSNTWYRYDKKGNKIYSKDSEGKEVWYEYNSNNKEIHTKDSAGNETWCEYDSKGRMIYHKVSGGYEYWYQYDSNGNMVYEKDKKNHEIWNEYDSNNNLIHKKDSDGYEIWFEYYAELRKISYSKDSEGNESWYEYDKYGNTLTHMNKMKNGSTNVYVHKLEYHKDGKTLKKDTCYWYERR